MKTNRRDFIKGAGAAIACAAGVTLLGADQSQALPVRVGMTDWDLGERGNVAKVDLARQIGLDGIQVSLIFPEDGSPHLRSPKVQEQYKKASLANGIQICSLAIGSPGKTRMPLHTHPAAAILLVEAIEVAHNLGTDDILYPVLGNSHINMENTAEVQIFVSMMKEVARHAEKAGVVVSLEDWLSAQDNMRLLDAIGSDYVGVYYDPANVKAKVHDPYGEIKLLGKRIHQVHVKNGKMLMSEKNLLDWPRLAEELYEAGYKGWYVMETFSPSGDVVKDSRNNLDYVRRTFKMPV